MRILFLCTHNHCRSILAEAITNHIAGGRIEAASAGSFPSGAVNQLGLRSLAARGIATDQLKSQGLQDFSEFSPRVIITLCDSAAQEPCPVWASDVVNVHWGLPDPSKLKGSEVLQQDAFQTTIDQLESRIKRLLRHDFENYDDDKLRACLNEIAARD